MSALDRNSVRAIQVDMMDALKAVALKHGVQFEYKGGTFTSSNVRFRIEAAVIGNNGVVENVDRKNYEVFAVSYGLKKEWLDKTFRQGGDTFKIVGLATRRSKNPVVCTCERNGKPYIFPVHLVQLYMGIPTVATT